MRSGEVTAVDVVRAHLDHIDAVDARIGAFRVLRRDAALAEAHAIDTALDPVRAAARRRADRGQGQRGRRGRGLHRRVAGRQRRPGDADHPVVARLRKAGAVVVGITRVPELCLYGTTDGPGTVSRNPWDTARSPGGSSGRQRGRGRRGLRPARARQRRHGLAPHPGRRLRAGHPQAGPGCRAGRDRPGQLVGHGRERRPGHDGRRPRRRPRGAGGGGARPRPPPPAGRCGSPSPRAPRSRVCAPTRPALAAVDAVVARARRRRAHRRPPRSAAHHRRRARRTRAVDGRCRRRRHPLRAGPRGAAAAQPHARPHRPDDAPRRAWSGRARGSGSGSGWPASSRTSTCCSPR